MTLDASELALRLHMTGQPVLRLELQPGEVVSEGTLAAGYVVQDRSIEFASLAERNRLIAEYAFEHVRGVLSTKPDELFVRARELWREEIGHPDQASGRLVALAAVQLDVFAHASKRIRQGENVFDVLHLLEAGMPYFDTLDLDSLIDLCEAKYEKTKNDLAGGMFHGALENWLASRPLQARQLRERASANPTEATASLLGNSLLALAKSDYAAAAALAMADAVDELPLRAGSEVWTLGRLLLEENAPAEALASVTATVLSLIEASDGDRRVRVIRAATGAMHRSSSFDAVLKRLAAAGDQDVLAGVATTLFLHAGDMMRRGDLPQWLDLLTGLRPDKLRPLNELDNALAQLMKEPSNIPLVAETLTKWVTLHGKGGVIDKSVAELFPSTVAKLVSHEAAWSKLLTRWLLSDEQAHAACIAGVFMTPQHREPTLLQFDTAQLDGLDAEGLLFLARRMLGYVFDREQVTSLAFSMLRSRDAKDRIFPLLGNLLVKEIGYDYPGSTRQACESAVQTSSSADERQFLQAVTTALALADKALEDLPRRKELQPPMRLRRLFALARATQMNKAMEQAQKKSVLRQLMTEIPIKAGRGTFSYHRDSYGPTTQMSSISHSVELPRREVFDPVGNAIRLLQFRLAKRNKK